MGKTLDAPATPDATGDVRPQDESTPISNVLGRMLAAALTDAVRDPGFRAQARDVFAELLGAAPKKTTDLSATEAARAVGVSNATFRRFALVPSYFAGDERSPRFDLDDVRRQLRERGPRATTPAKATQRREIVDIDGALSAAGLRRASR